MEALTLHAALKMTLELTLGIGIKLFCDNGRIHYADFVNDFLFWLPGVNRRPNDGLSRQIEDMQVVTDAPLATELLAAK